MTPAYPAHVVYQLIRSAVVQVRGRLTVPNAKDATVTPKCGTIGTVFQITAQGFQPNEGLSYWLTAPDQSVFGTEQPLNIPGGYPGSFRDAIDSTFFALLGNDAYGIWAVTYEGATSHHQSIVWFKVLPR